MSVRAMLSMCVGLLLMAGQVLAAECYVSAYASNGSTVCVRGRSFGGANVCCVGSGCDGSDVGVDGYGQGPIDVSAVGQGVRGSNVKVVAIGEAPCWQSCCRPRLRVVGTGIDGSYVRAFGQMGF